MKWNDKVDRTCLTCGKHFTVLAYKLKYGQGQFCSRSCKSRFTASHRQDYYPSEETRRKISATLKKRADNLKQRKREQVKLRVSKARSEEVKRAWRDPKRRATMMKNLSAGHKKTWKDPNFKTKMSQIHKNLWQDTDFMKMMSEANSKSAKKRWQNPEYRQHQIEAQTRSWLNLEVVAKRVGNANKHPNKPEQKLIDILGEYLPEFKYNGDFSLGISLGGLIPDFVNVNGKKELIELFGDYYHSPEVTNNDWRRSELGKIMIYNSLGWECLVIWEHELKNMTDGEIAAKAKSFFRKIK